MATITSTGLGSGLEVNNIVKGLVDAEKEPQIDKINREATKATEQISALGQLNSTLSSLQGAYDVLKSKSSFNSTTASSADSTIVTAKTTIGAEPGVYDLQVEQLAQNHTIVTGEANRFSSVEDVVGGGKIQIRFGEYSTTSNSFELNGARTVHEIDVDANTTLTELRDQINSKDYGVKASIINDGEGYRLIFQSSDSGAKNAMEITVTDDDGNNNDASGLSLLHFDETSSAAGLGGTNNNMAQSLEAQDARVVVNGITIKRETNEIDSVANGITFNAVNAEPGKNVRVSVATDITDVETEIRGFVDAFNETMTTISKLMDADGSSGEVGALVGDAAVRNVQSLLRGILNTRLDNIDSSVKSIADLGIITKRDGTLEINEDTTNGFAVFSEVLAESTEDVAKFFAQSGATSESQISFVSSSSLTQEGTYNVEVTQLATQGKLTAAAVLPSDFSATPFVIDADNDNFTVRIDGSASNEISLEQGSYNSEAALIAEIQSKINSDSKLQAANRSVSVAIENNRLVITSNTWGSVSNVGFTAVDTNFAAELGIGVEAGTAGVNAEGKINGADALGDGRYLLAESASGGAVGLKVEVLGGALGSRGTVSFSEGMTAKIDTILDSMIDSSISNSQDDLDISNTIIDGKIDSLYKRLQELDRKEADINFKMDAYEARLFKQFNAMDLLVSQLNGTSNALQNSLDALPGYTRNNN